MTKYCPDKKILQMYITRMNVSFFLKCILLSRVFKLYYLRVQKVSCKTLFDWGWSRGEISIWFLEIKS